MDILHELAGGVKKDTYHSDMLKELTYIFAYLHGRFSVASKRLNAWKPEANLDCCYGR